MAPASAASQSTVTAKLGPYHQPAWGRQQLQPHRYGPDLTWQVLLMRGLLQSCLMPGCWQGAFRRFSQRLARASCTWTLLCMGNACQTPLDQVYVHITHKLCS